MVLRRLLDSIRSQPRGPKPAQELARPGGETDRLTKLYVEPTTRCNLQCRTCMRNTWSEPGGDLSMDIFSRLMRGVEQLGTVQTVALWGIGEPLLHPRILEMVREAGRRGVATEMVTNGMLLDQAAARGLVDAGLGRLVLSVDGTSSRSYADVRRGGELDALRQNMEHLRDAAREAGMPGPDVGVEFVLMRSNLSELPRLPSLARELGASHAILTNLLPYTAELKDEILYWLSAGDPYSAARFADDPADHAVLPVQVPKIDALPEYLPYLRELGRPVEGDGRHMLALADADGRCPFVEEGAAAVAWDGRVSPCVALMHTHTCYVMDREKAIRGHSLGDVTRRPLADIWVDEEFARFRRRVREFNYSPCVSCGGCDMVEANEEDCFGNTHPTCGDCLWARGVIVCP